jgi:hypothetical protein
MSGTPRTDPVTLHQFEEQTLGVGDIPHLAGRDRGRRSWLSSRGLKSRTSVKVWIVEES